MNYADDHNHQLPKSLDDAIAPFGVKLAQFRADDGSIDYCYINWDHSSLSEFSGEARPVIFEKSRALRRHDTYVVLSNGAVFLDRGALWLHELGSQYLEVRKQLEGSQ